MDTWTKIAQHDTKIVAHKAGDHYTSADLTMIAQLEGEAIKELAIKLGRSYFATSTIKGMIAAGKIATDRQPKIAATDRPYRGWVEGMIDSE